MSEQIVGDLLDRSGLTLNLGEDVMLTDAVLIAKILYPDGASGVIVGTSEGISWVEEAGMLSVANLVMEQQIFAMGSHKANE